MGYNRTVVSETHCSIRVPGSEIDDKVTNTFYGCILVSLAGTLIARLYMKIPRDIVLIMISRH